MRFLPITHRGQSAPFGLWGSLEDSFVQQGSSGAVLERARLAGGFEGDELGWSGEILRRCPLGGQGVFPREEASLGRGAWQVNHSALCFDTALPLRVSVHPANTQGSSSRSDMGQDPAPSF